MIVFKRSNRLGIVVSQFGESSCRNKLPPNSMRLPIFACSRCFARSVLENGALLRTDILNPNHEQSVRIPNYPGKATIGGSIQLHASVKRTPRRLQVRLVQLGAPASSVS